MNVFPSLKPRMENAIINAKRVEEYHLKLDCVLDDENCNPYTGVYKVVEELIERNTR